MMTMDEFKYDSSILSSCASHAAVNGDHQDCRELFQQHQAHYQRDRSNELELSRQNRYNRFLENAVFVHDHNSQRNRHRVALNRFSDLLHNEFPLHEDAIGDTETASSKNTTSSVPSDISADVLTHKHRIKKKRQERDQNNNHTFEARYYPVSPHGGKKGHLRYLLEDSFLSHLNATIEFNNDPRGNQWKTHINWSNEQNPDGVLLVHPPIDQGDCGSCWAFAATGTVETVASRHIAFHVYHSIFDRLSNTDSSIESIENHRQEAIKLAQQAERYAMKVAKLSTQELVDCDRKYDQGCTGGNPVMAFPFIHKHGLVSSIDYPYVGEQKDCHRNNLKGAIATATSWAVLEPRNEQNMDSVLRHLGPIAVGINGNDKSFTHYKSGIFESIKCGRRPNHALLIVGYGEEETNNGIEKYWIARNSWGVGWGMNGYIRIKRHVEKEKRGVCGIANNPSIAIGGTLIDDHKIIKLWEGSQNIQLEDSVKGAKEPQFTSLEQNVFKNNTGNLGAAHGESLTWVDYSIWIAPLVIIVAIAATLVCISRRPTERFVMVAKSSSCPDENAAIRRQKMISYGSAAV